MNPKKEPPKRLPFPELTKFRLDLRSATAAPTTAKRVRASISSADECENGGGDELYVCVVSHGRF